MERTICACEECVACCRRQPGALAPGDFERIAEHLQETPAQAMRWFRASPGALVKDSFTGQLFRIGTITPHFEHGRCVFLDEQDRCRIHAVAPFGCSHFDTHMGLAESLRRSRYLAMATHAPEYQAFRDKFAQATHYRPRSY